MNLDTFRSRVVQSTSVAVNAAREFSSFDEMAENDEYVQSEGLNVSNKKKDRSKDGTVLQYESSSVVENLSDKFVDALSSAAKPKTRNNREDSRAPMSSNKEMGSATTRAHSSELVSSVAALYEYEQDNPYAEDTSHKNVLENNNHRHTTHRISNNTVHEHVSSTPIDVIVANEHAHILHQLNYESDNDSSTDDESIEIHINNSVSAQYHTNTLQHQADEKNKKDPHRFMAMAEDLEERKPFLHSDSVSAKINNLVPQTEFNVNGMAEPYLTPAGHETGNALKAGLSWVKKFASPQLQALSKQVMTKLAENNFTIQGRNLDRINTPMIGPRNDNISKSAQTEDTILMASSETFLADADMAELERIRSKHSFQITLLIRTCGQSLWENPRLAFVAATLSLAIVVYYYSRKRSINDVL